MPPTLMFKSTDVGHPANDLMMDLDDSVCLGWQKGVRKWGEERKRPKTIAQSDGRYSGRPLVDGRLIWES